MNETTKQKRKPGRPTKPLAEQRTERISFGVTKVQKAAFLINASTAGMASNDYARQVLCQQPGEAVSSGNRTNYFELIDGLSRLATDLARLRFIAEQTGVVPSRLDGLVERLDRKLDVLIVGAGIAEELEQHRAAIRDIGRKLETRQGMTDRARGMIATFDQVVNKVLSA